MEQDDCQPAGFVRLTMPAVRDSFCAVMGIDLYSVRMLAEAGGKHLSGAERLVPLAQVEHVSAALLQRALISEPGTVSLKIDRVDTTRLQRGRLPDLQDIRVDGWQQGWVKAEKLLGAAGIPVQVVRDSIACIAGGASPSGSNMRGAMLVDAVTGERLEPDRHRGVRASCFDLSAEIAATLPRQLASSGLGHHRIREALVLAAKVLAGPGIVAELCWSDDPDYLTGYVTTQAHGYCRLTPLKEQGDCHGGRVFFVRHGSDVAGLIEFLEQTPFLVDSVGRIIASEDMSHG